MARVNDLRRARESQGIHRCASLLTPARRGDCPTNIPGIETRQKVFREGKRARIEVENLVDLTGTSVDDFGLVVCEIQARGFCHISGEELSIAPNERSEISLHNGNGPFLERTVPSFNPSPYIVDQGPVEVEDDSAGMLKRLPGEDPELTPQWSQPRHSLSRNSV